MHWLSYQTAFDWSSERWASMTGTHWPLERVLSKAPHNVSLSSRGGHYGCSLSPVRPWLWSSSVGWRLFENICIWKRKMRRFSAFLSGKLGRFGDCNAVTALEWLRYVILCQVSTATSLSRLLCCSDAVINRWAKTLARRSSYPICGLAELVSYSEQLIQPALTLQRSQILAAKRTVSG